jgi:hypothetical protein
MSSIPLAACERLEEPQACLIGFWRSPLGKPTPSSMRRKYRVTHTKPDIGAGMQFSLAIL